MAIWEDLLTEEGGGTASLIGLGAVIAAPVIFPTVGAVVRPLIKGLIWGVFVLTDSARGLLTGVGRQLSDTYEEARREYEHGHEQDATANASPILTPASATANPEARILTPEGKYAEEE